MCDECQELRRQLTALETAARAFVETPIGRNRMTLAALVGVDLPAEYEAYRQQVAEHVADKRDAQTVAMLAGMVAGDGD